MLTKNEEFHFFWRGPFSQWVASEFTVDKQLYNNAEQYMMSEKALLFSDINLYKKMLETKDPKEIKKLGREVSNFDEAIWEQNRFSIVLKGSLAKFSQNQDLKNKLLSTGLKTLVEASPHDTIWGIGLSEDDPDIYDRSKWKGLNLLGQALTMTRELIKVI
jgi:ribA/ribD-fused uncharacterized protein